MKKITLPIVFLTREVGESNWLAISSSERMDVLGLATFVFGSKCSSLTTMCIHNRPFESELGLKALTLPPSPHHHLYTFCIVNRSDIKSSPSCMDGDKNLKRMNVNTSHSDWDKNLEKVNVKTTYHTDGDKNLKKINVKRSRVKKEFPPPISLLGRTEHVPCHMSSVLKRYYEDGHLVIREVPVEHHEYFLADRSNGRLVLHLVHHQHQHHHQHHKDGDHAVNNDDDEKVDDDVHEQQKQQEKPDIVLRSTSKPLTILASSMPEGRVGSLKNSKSLSNSFRMPIPKRIHPFQG